MDGYETILGHRIHYIKQGQGKPIILLHGLEASASQWEENIPELSKHFTVYAIDLPGYGLSDSVHENELDVFFAPIFLHAFIEQLEIRKPILIGGSFGGLVALHYTLYFQSDVSKLVLMDSAGLGKEIKWYWKLISVPVLGSILMHFYTHSLRRDDSWIWYFERVPILGIFLKEMHKVAQENEKNNFTPFNSNKTTIQLVKNGISLRGQKDSIVRYNDLKRINVPTLILWGKNDKTFPLKQAEEAARSIKNSKLHVFKNAGHWPSKDCVDEFNLIVIEFASS